MTRPRSRQRREHRRARADAHPRLAAAQPLPLVVALTDAQRRVQDRDDIAEAGLKAPQDLGGERNLGHEHDGRAPGLQGRGDRLEVDLGLARAGDAVQQEAGVGAGGLLGRARPGPVQCGLLVVGERRRGGAGRTDRMTGRAARALAQSRARPAPRASRRRRLPVPSSAATAGPARARRPEQLALAVGEPGLWVVEGRPARRGQRRPPGSGATGLPRWFPAAGRGRAPGPVVEQYSAAIHSASATRSAGIELGRTSSGSARRSAASSECAASLDHDPEGAPAAERHPQDRADTDLGLPASGSQTRP